MNVRNLIFALAFAAASLAPASAAEPTSAVMETVDGAIAQTNADSASGLNSYFTSSSVVVDDFSPFIWIGANAAERWWRQFDEFKATARISNVRASAGRPLRIIIAGDKAYVVVPLKLSSLMHGSLVRRRGMWTLVLQRFGGAWKIASASFSALP